MHADPSGMLAARAIVTGRLLAIAEFVAAAHPEIADLILRRVGYVLTGETTITPAAEALLDQTTSLEADIALLRALAEVLERTQTIIRRSTAN